MNIKRETLCDRCRKIIRKADADYIRGYRLKKRAEILKKQGLLRVGVGEKEITNKINK